MSQDKTFAPRAMRTDLAARFARRLQRLGRRADALGSSVETWLHTLAGRVLGCRCDNYWNWQCHAGRRWDPARDRGKNCACTCHPVNNYDGPAQYDPPEQVPVSASLSPAQREALWRVFLRTLVLRDWTRQEHP